ncbi:MAG: hypothetical protein ACP5VS_06985 [Desulfomonilaceae bacterium]
MKKFASKLRLVAFITVFAILPIVAWELSLTTVDHSQRAAKGLSTLAAMPLAMVMTTPYANIDGDYGYANNYGRVNLKASTQPQTSRIALSDENSGYGYGENRYEGGSGGGDVGKGSEAGGQGGGGFNRVWGSASNG